MADGRSAEPESASNEMPVQCQFAVLPSGRNVTSAMNRTYAEALADHALAVPMDCGLAGTCGKCRIRFVSRAPEPSASGVRLLSTEAIHGGWRLACQQPVEADVVIEVPSSDDRLQTAELPALHVENLRPGVESFAVTVPPLAEAETESGDQTISRALGETCHSSPEVLRLLSECLQDQQSAFTGVRRGNQVLDLRPGSAPGGVLGLAIDVGTTTLAVYLYDLLNGNVRASEAAYNPQRAMGADVISRIGYVREHAEVGLKHLQQVVVDELNALVERACEHAGVSARDIYKTVVAGNPTMLHLLVGISPVGIDRSPYTPVFLESRVFTPPELGFHAHPEGEVLLLPGISSYVGADIVAGVLATSLGSPSRNELLVDIGTNGEIVLVANGRFIACSTAAGPAFEGAAIRDGVSAIPGAIDDVVINEGSVQCTTVGGLPATGICGTGLLAAVHELLKSGHIDTSGRLTKGQGALSELCRQEGKDAHFVLGTSSPFVSIYQEDIRALQLGKAAIRAGIDTLLEFANVAPEDLDCVHVAGAFGTHLQPARALGTGLLPSIETKRIRAVGNTAGQGAAIVLLDDCQRVDADAIADRVNYVELAAEPGFAKRYLERMAFPAP